MFQLKLMLGLIVVMGLVWVAGMMVMRRQARQEDSRPTYARSPLPQSREKR